MQFVHCTDDDLIKMEKLMQNKKQKKLSFERHFLVLYSIENLSVMKISFFNHFYMSPLVTLPGSVGHEIKNRQ